MYCLLGYLVSEFPSHAWGIFHCMYDLDGRQEPIFQKPEKTDILFVLGILGPGLT